MFRLRLKSSWVRIYFYKKYKGNNLKIACVADKHCGNNRYNVCVRVKAVKTASIVLFWKILPIVFLQKKFFCSFNFCKFSYLDQFHSYTCTIHLYRFYHNVYPSQGQFLSFFLFSFYRNKFSLMRTPIWVETFENMKLWDTFFLDPKAS